MDIDHKVDRLPSSAPAADQKKALGDLICRRREELSLSQEKLTELGGPSPETLRQYEIGNIPDRPQDRTLASLDRALLWRVGSARSVLVDGAAPLPVIEEPGSHRSGQHVTVESKQVARLLNVSAELLQCAKRQPLRPDVSAAVNQLHLIASELGVQALNQ
ncbi:helix-turn-helix domain-containing protein [Rhodococcus marinonascens]|uniref:helix-turn-helix domain-containing protein n=1 Tax=Rhodococcus marinonascens TaxID=38311 RepID=UPI00093260D1|nr:helix-turn-helix domain-containing protein [Rhodococcus marinonascens]